MKISRAFISQMLRHRMSVVTLPSTMVTAMLSTISRVCLFVTTAATGMPFRERLRWQMPSLRTSGVTGLAIGTGINHFHRFRITTAIAQGHRHIISGRTTTVALMAFPDTD